VTITYQLGTKLYINLTNRCSNDCNFCVRNFKDGVGGYNLWLEKEPTVEEIIGELKSAGDYQEIVFCGYGEPLTRLKTIIEVASYLKENFPELPIKIDTNGQANLIHEENVLPKLEGLIDKVSVSLNASSSEKYQQLCDSEFGDQAYPAVLEFIRQAQDYIPEVVASVVAQPEVDIEKCEEVAHELGVKLRVR
jgi:TatD family-associated radical SAM protein